jgi:hypothetical protein
MMQHSTVVVSFTSVCVNRTHKKKKKVWVTCQKKYIPQICVILRPDKKLWWRKYGNKEFWKKFWAEVVGCICGWFLFA